jgi:hypothetical protein
MLSILCFLQRLAEYTGREPLWQGIVATDSQSLLDTLHSPAHVESSTEEQHTRRTARRIKQFPLDPLLPEWDVVRGIQELAQRMSGLRLLYVAGHQDKKTAVHKLPLLAQLNVEADALAS